MQRYNGTLLLRILLGPRKARYSGSSLNRGLIVQGAFQGVRTEGSLYREHSKGSEPRAHCTGSIPRGQNRGLIVQGAFQGVRTEGHVTQKEIPFNFRGNSIILSENYSIVYLHFTLSFIITFFKKISLAHFANNENIL